MYILSGHRFPRQGSIVFTTAFQIFNLDVDFKGTLNVLQENITTTQLNKFIEPHGNILLYKLHIFGIWYACGLHLAC